MIIETRPTLCGIFVLWDISQADYIFFSVISFYFIFPFDIKKLGSRYEVTCKRRLEFLAFYLFHYTYILASIDACIGTGLGLFLGRFSLETNFFCCGSYLLFMYSFFSIMIPWAWEDTYLYQHIISLFSLFGFGLGFWWHVCTGIYVLWKFYIPSCSRLTYLISILFQLHTLAISI